MRCCFLAGLWTLVAACLSVPSASAGTPPARLKLLVPARYLPQVPVLVRVEALRSDGGRELSLWDADPTLSVTSPGITLSTNRVHLRNGLGSALVTISGGNDFELKAALGTLSATKTLADASGLPASTVAGTLSTGDTEWSGLVQVTGTVTVPVGGTLTILSNTIVLVSGPTGTTNNIVVAGTLRSLGTEDFPVTITCATANQRWG